MLILNILVYCLLIQNNHIFMLFMFIKLPIDFLKKYPFISQKLNFTFY